MTCKCCKCNEPQHMWPTGREYFNDNPHKFSKCNEKTKFVVGNDVKEGELGFYLIPQYNGGIAIEMSNRQALLGITPNGAFKRYRFIDSEKGLQLDEYLRIKVSE